MDLKIMFNALISILGLGPDLVISMHRPIFCQDRLCDLLLVHALGTYIPCRLVCGLLSILGFDV